MPAKRDLFTRIGNASLADALHHLPASHYLKTQRLLLTFEGKILRIYYSDDFYKPGIAFEEDGKATFLGSGKPKVVGPSLENLLIPSGDKEAENLVGVLFDQSLFRTSPFPNPDDLSNLYQLWLGKNGLVGLINLNHAGANPDVPLSFIENTLDELYFKRVLMQMNSLGAIKESAEVIFDKKRVLGNVVPWFTRAYKISEVKEDRLIIIDKVKTPHTTNISINRMSELSLLRFTDPAAEALRTQFVQYYPLLVNYIEGKPLLVRRNDNLPLLLLGAAAVSVAAVVGSLCIGANLASNFFMAGPTATPIATATSTAYPSPLVPTQTILATPEATSGAVLPPVPTARPTTLPLATLIPTRAPAPSPSATYTPRHPATARPPATAVPPTVTRVPPTVYVPPTSVPTPTAIYFPPTPAPVGDLDARLTSLNQNMVGRFGVSYDLARDMYFADPANFRTLFPEIDPATLDGYQSNRELVGYHANPQKCNTIEGSALFIDAIENKLRIYDSPNGSCVGVNRRVIENFGRNRLTQVRQFMLDYQRRNPDRIVKVNVY
ncbi:hypothetical protein HYU11_02775 [Candidatus Woesearchaeota archaeon]|nr:hypothetical protein [Candidatus Woesearchaeota archaeon]